MRGIKLTVDIKQAQVSIGNIKIGFDEIGNKAQKASVLIGQAFGRANRTLTGSLRRLRDHKQTLEALQATVTDNNKKYRQFQVEIDKVQKRIEALTDTREEHEMVHEGSIASIEREIQKQKEYQLNVATSTEEVEKYQAAIEDLERKKAQLTGTTGKLGKANESFSSSAGIAGSTATEFGRVIADSPYGLQGMANNIEQLSQQFVDLRNKAGGTGQAFKSLLNTLIGPAGFVVGVQVISAALQFYQRRQQEVAKATDSVNEASGEAGATLKTYLSLMESNLLTEQQRIDLTKEASEEFEDLNFQIDANARLTDVSTLAIRKQIEAMEDAAKARAFQSLIEEEYKKQAIGFGKEARGGFLFYMKSLIGSFGGVAGAAIAGGKQAAKNEEELLEESVEKVKGYLEELAKLNAKIFDGLGKDGDQEDPKKPGTIAYFEELISKLQEQQSEVITTSEAYDEIAKKIAVYEDQIENITREKEKERQQELKELKLDYSQEILEETQKDELQKLFIQEEAAKQEALALGATKDDLLLIEEAYQIRRGKIVDKYQKEEDKKLKDAKKAAETSIKERYKLEVDAMKEAVQQLTDVFSNFSNILSELGEMSQHRYERQINNIKSEKELVKQNENLSVQEKESALTYLQQRENEIQKKRIKAERDMFTIKQTIMLSEMILKQRMMVQEQIMLTKQSALITKMNAQQTMNDVTMTGAEQIGKAGMSIGEFMKQLGPFGIAAFALSIGGVIASIISARKKAQAEIAGLSNAPVKIGRSSGGASSPIFNVVGATSQNQLAETISEAQSKPVRAYVVSNEVTTAQGLERNILEGASI